MMFLNDFALKLQEAKEYDQRIALSPSTIGETSIFFLETSEIHT